MKITIRKNVKPYQAGLEEIQVESLNAFGGADTEEQQVLHSCAGFYVGTLEFNGTFWVPYSRDSAEYFPTREEAEEALIRGYYEPAYPLYP